MESRTQIELPSYVSRPFEVFVNGIPQTEGTDYELVGTALVFPRRLVQEGKVGFWRWLRMALGVAGYYRQNDTVDVVFTHGGKRIVKGLAVPPPDAADEEGRRPDGGTA